MTTYDAFNSTIAFKVYSHVADPNRDSYATQIGRDINFKQPTISTALSNLKEEDLVEKERKGKSVHYFAIEGRLYGEFSDMWDEYGVDVSHFVPPGLFTAYTQSYMSPSKDRTLEQMLVRDFYTSLSMYIAAADNPHPELDMMHTQMRERFDDTDLPTEHMAYAVQTYYGSASQVENTED